MIFAQGAVDSQFILLYDDRLMRYAIRNISISGRGAVVRLDDFPDPGAA